MAWTPRIGVLAQAGDLVGNWSWSVWLLVPLVLVLAALTAFCLGSAGDPPRARTGAGGVSRYLSRTATKEEDR